MVIKCPERQKLRSQVKFYLLNCHTFSTDAVNRNQVLISTINLPQSFARLACTGETINPDKKRLGIVLLMCV